MFYLVLHVKEDRNSFCFMILGIPIDCLDSD